MAILLALMLFIFGFGAASVGTGTGSSHSSTLMPPKTVAGAPTRVRPRPPLRDRCNDGHVRGRTSDHKKPLPMRSCAARSGVNR